MKKFIFLMLLTISGLAVIAQSTSPRFGTAKNQDNTGRVLTYTYVSVTDAAGADSVTATPAAFETIYRVSLTDSLTMSQPVVTKSYAGDNITIIASAASGTPKLKFYGSYWQTAGTATLSTGLRAVIKLVFDGSKWVEASRVVQ